MRVTVSPASGGDQQVLEADKFLSAIGFAPRTEGYGLETTGVELTDRGAVAIDEYCRTNVPNVYAIGDCTAKLMLAHVAEAQGVVAAETLAGADTMPVDYDFVPRATYCHPQIGSFGYSEAQAEERATTSRPRRSRSPRTARPWAWATRSGSSRSSPTRSTTRSSVRTSSARTSPRLLPVLTLAQKWDLTADEVARNVFAHPTLSEAVKEAVEGIAGHMISF